MSTMKDENIKNVKISKEAHKILKTYCVENDLSINEFATQLVLQQIESEQKKQKNQKPKDEK